MIVDNIIDFVDKVQKMRTLQKEYFKNRNKDILVKSKRAEKEVDDILFNRNNPPLF